MTIKIQFEQALIEEAVFLAAKSAEDSGQVAIASRFHNGINHIYDRFTGEAREHALAKFYEDFFYQLGFPALLEQIAGELAVIARTEIPISVRRVWDRKLEGAELYVRDGMKNILISFQTVRITNRPLLTSFLRHELMHVADMLDPGFQYRPDPDLGGTSEIENDMIRGRFHLLWNLYVSIRILHMGHTPFLAIERLKANLQASFPPTDRPAGETIDHALIRQRLTQDDLLALARGERRHRLIGEGGRLCPLCGFTSFDRMDFLAPENRSAAQIIQAERPDWSPSMGSCRQCFEVYQATHTAQAMEVRRWI